MKNDYTGLELLDILENSTEVTRIRKYKNKTEAANELPYAIHRVGFYGRILNGSVSVLDRGQIIFNSYEDIILVIEGVVSLTREPVNNGTGEIIYSGYGILEVDGTPIYGGSGATSKTTTVTGDFTPQGDGGNKYIVDSTSPVYVTMNLDACGLGEEIEFYQAGIGQIRLIDGTGTVVADVSVSKKSSSQYSTIAIKENIEGVFNVLGQTE